MKNCYNCGAYMGCKQARSANCEAWEPRTTFVFADMAADYLSEIGWTGDYTLRKEKGHYVLTLIEEWPHERKN